MRQQMKTLEEKNEVYMQQTINLEEDAKRASSLKAQADAYKTQIHDLHNKLLDTEKRCDKAEFDAQRGRDKLQSVEAENLVTLISNTPYCSIYFYVCCFRYVIVDRLW